MHWKLQEEILVYDLGIWRHGYISILIDQSNGYGEQDGHVNPNSSKAYSIPLQMISPTIWI
jgi:hypothetical protein